MHIVSLSLDPQILDPSSVVAKRTSGYGAALDSLTVIVPVQEAGTVKLTDTVTVYGTGGRTKLGRLWRMYQLVKTVMITKQCDVVTSQDAYFLALLGYIAARRYHCGLEVQVHGLEKLRLVRRFVMRFLVRRASLVRVASKRLERFVREDLGVTHDRVVVIPVHVDTTLSVAAEGEIDLDFQKKYGDRLNIVTVSRLVPVKNIALQLQAAAALRSKFPNMLWHIVGDGPLKEALALQIKHLGLEEHVIMHGQKTQTALQPFFTQTQCFVLTSFSEGWGMAVIEAAAAGLPIVMTDVGCAGEVIIDGKNGIVLKDRTPETLISAMRDVLGNDALRVRLGNAAKKAVAALPDFEAVRSQYVRAWEIASRTRL